LVALSDDSTRIVRRELRSDADRLEWGDACAFSRNLDADHDHLLSFLARSKRAGRRIHVFAEPTRPDGVDVSAVDRALTCADYEARCHQLSSTYGCEVTCLWDLRCHPALTVENARRLHSRELKPTGLEIDAGSVDPQQYLAGSGARSRPLDASVYRRVTISEPGSLVGLRTTLDEWSRRRGMSYAAAKDLVLAVNEIATNGLVHGRPPVEVWAWSSGRALVVQVEDRGARAIPANAGARPPADPGRGGSGLWLARQLCSAFQTHSGQGRTSVRLYFSDLGRN
jgi:anti-sigma regulatory factor (Ser/Thr protein kinase)